MEEIEKTSCDFSFRGWPDPDGLPEDAEPPWRPARPQRVQIDLEQHANYLEEPSWVGRSSTSLMKACSGISLSWASMTGTLPR